MEPLLGATITQCHTVGLRDLVTKALLKTTLQAREGNWLCQDRLLSHAGKQQGCSQGTAVVAYWHSHPLREAEKAATPSAGQEGLALCPTIRPLMQAIISHECSPGLASTLLARQNTQLLHHWLSAPVRQAEAHPAGQVRHIDAQQRLELLCVQEEPPRRLQAVV